MQGQGKRGPLYVRSYFSLFASNILSLSLTFDSLTIMSWWVSSGSTPRDSVLFGLGYSLAKRFKNSPLNFNAYSRLRATALNLFSQKELSEQKLAMAEPALPKARVPHLPAVLERCPWELTAVRLRLRSVLKVGNSKHRQAGIHIANHAPKRVNRFYS